MQQTLFTAMLAVVVIFILLYRWKKRAENKMGNDLNALIESNDWRGVCRILRKQLIIWGSLLVLFIGLSVARIVIGEKSYTTIIVCAFIGWRFLKLVRLYRISYQNMKTVESSDDDTQQVSVEEFLHDCKLTHIENGMPSDKITQLWLDAYERGKKNGYCPVLLEAGSCFYDSLSDNAEWSDETKFREWQTKVLNSDTSDGKAILHERFKRIKEEYTDNTDWENDIVGKDEGLTAINDFEIEEGTSLYLVEVPVKEPWQVFAYIPMGGWNECPEAEEHMAIARYWHEKYGAAVACISNDTIQYHLPQPIVGDTMPLAEEHLGYCEDVLQGDNLASLSSLIKKSTVWYFWWD